MIVATVTDAAGAVVSTVTAFVDAALKLPAASTVYTLYVPSSKPDADKLVLVFAEAIEALLYLLSPALVMLVSVVTGTVSLTKYAVPPSVL